MTKFKDEKGHTIYMNTEANGIRAMCPYCDEIVSFWEVA